MGNRVLAAALWVLAVWAGSPGAGPEREVPPGGTHDVGLQQRDQAASSIEAPAVLRPPWAVDFPAGYDPRGERRYPLVLLLHGRGSNGAAMAGLAAALGLPGIIYVRPDAPYPIASGEAGYEYWPQWVKTTGNEEALLRAARNSAALCGAIVRELLGTERVARNSVFVVGFSQGGALAYLAALENPELFAGVAALAGWVLPAYQRASCFETLADHGTAILIIHGSEDRVVAPAQAKIARDLARAAGLDVKLEVHPGGHTLPGPMVRELGAWVLEMCAQRARR